MLKRLLIPRQRRSKGGIECQPPPPKPPKNYVHNGEYVTGIYIYMYVRSIFKVRNAKNVPQTFDHGFKILEGGKKKAQVLSRKIAPESLASPPTENNSLKSRHPLAVILRPSLLPGKIDYIYMVFSEIFFQEYLLKNIIQIFSLCPIQDSILFFEYLISRRKKSFFLVKNPIPVNSFQS